MDSILISIKKMLGLEEGYDVFDTDILVHINTVFMTLTQLGIGPSSGFEIVGREETWDEYPGYSAGLSGIKSYIYLKVRLVFDPPQSGFLVDAITKQIAELEWRLNVQAEGGTTA